MATQYLPPHTLFCTVILSLPCQETASVSPPHWIWVGPLIALTPVEEVTQSWSWPSSFHSQTSRSQPWYRIILDHQSRGKSVERPSYVERWEEIRGERDRDRLRRNKVPDTEGSYLRQSSDQWLQLLGRLHARTMRQNPGNQQNHGREEGTALFNPLCKPEGGSLGSNG